MPSVIFFTDISEPEIVFLNEVYDHLARKGITLRMVVFKDYHKCIKKLKCDCIYLKTFNLFNLSLPKRKKRDINSYNGDFLQKLVLLEKEINKNCEIDVTDYERRLNNLIGFVENMAKVTSACFVMSRSYTVYKVIKKVLANKNINFVPFEKWTFAGTYQFNTYGLEQPRLDRDLKVNGEDQYHSLLQKLFLNYKGRHKVNEEKQTLPEKYILLLLSDGCGGSYCLKNVEEYWTHGRGWGNDFEALRKVEHCVREKLPDCKLLVRQHPHTRYKFDKQHLDPKITTLANNFELDSLVDNADIIITAPGSISYYSLTKGKKPIILGNGELCGSKAVKCVDSVDELCAYISEIPDNKEAMHVDRETVIEAAMPYFKNQIWLNGERLTYRVLDKYIDSKKITEDRILIWYVEKIRILKYQAFIYIKSKLSAIRGKLKIRRA
jgi:hypothetical protein